VAAVLTGALVLAGWLAGVPFLQQIFPHLPKMVPVTAVALTLAGAALAMVRPEPVGGVRRGLAVAAAAFVTLVGLLTLSHYLFGWDLGLDWLLGFRPAAVSGVPGYPTGVALVLLGLALALLDVQPRRGPQPAQLLAFLAVVVALLALTGHVCNVPSFYGISPASPHNGTAVHAALLVALLGVGVVCARPDRGLVALLRDRGAGGVVARWLLLAPVVLPPLVAWIFGLGRQAGLYNHDVGHWLFSLTNIAVLTLIVWGSAGALRRIDAQRQQADAAVGLLNETLERRVAERTAELADANRELARQGRESELFVYSISHDLRSPLVNLEGFSRELSRVGQDLHDVLDSPGVPDEVRARCRALLDDDVAEAVRFIQAGVKQLNSVVDALLRLSRAGRVEYHWGPVEVGDIVGGVVEAMRSTIKERGATVRVNGLPPAWGDETAVAQVFANLIGNALKYLDPKRAGVIEVGSAGNGARGDRPGLLVYYVKDNGLGIPAASLPKVFRAFQRFHPEVAPGEGIGLAIVRRLVERHRGKVWVESRPGEGTGFYVALPSSAGPVEAKDSWRDKPE
jgi:signal transduction histidine kinase